MLNSSDSSLTSCGVLVPDVNVPTVARISLFQGVDLLGGSVIVVVAVLHELTDGGEYTETDLKWIRSALISRLESSFGLFPPVTWVVRVS